MLFAPVCVCVCVCMLFVCFLELLLGERASVCEDGDEGLAVMKRRGWRSTTILESGNRNRKSLWVYRGNVVTLIISLCLCLYEW